MILTYLRTPDSPPVRLSVPDKHDFADVGAAICRHLWPGWTDKPDLRFEAIMKRDQQLNLKEKAK